MKISQPSIPPVNSVTTAAIQNGAITEPKIDATLDARIAYKDLANIFTALQTVRLAAGDAPLEIAAGGALADQRRVRFVAQVSGGFDLRLLDDVGSFHSVFTVTRTGAVPQQFQWYNGLTHSFLNAKFDLAASILTFQNGQINFSALSALTFAAQQIDGAALKNGTVTSAKLAAGTLARGGWVASDALTSSLPASWTVVRNSIGDYTVTYPAGDQPATADQRLLTFSLFNAGAGLGGTYFVLPYANGVTGFSVQTWVNGVLADIEWQFISLDI